MISDRHASTKDTTPSPPPTISLSLPLLPNSTPPMRLRACYQPCHFQSCHIMRATISSQRPTTSAKNSSLTTPTSRRCDHGNFIFLALSSTPCQPCKFLCKY